MSILVKCNASDLFSTEPFSASILAEKDCNPTEGDEVFIWTSELPREGPRGIGLEARGSLLTWQRSGAKATLSAQIADRSPNLSLGMRDLARLGQRIPAARILYERIHKFRPSRIWTLTESDLGLLRDAFGDAQTIDTELLFDIDQIQVDATIPETTKKVLIDARRGQGRFRRGLEQRWGSSCALTGCRTPAVLRASHIKPWRLSTNSERLDPENGLLLAAHIDALFDSGLVSFDDHGNMIMSDELAPMDAASLHLAGKLRAKLTEREKGYLRHHRDKHFPTYLCNRTKVQGTTRVAD